MENKNFFRTAFYRIVVGTCIAVVVAICYLRNNAPVVFATAAEELAFDMFCVGVASIGAIPLAGVFILSLKILDWKALRVALGLAINKLSARIRAKNAAIILPRLQCFLFEVLLRNKEFLHLPLGQDPSCLTPRGRMIIDRDDCVFYRFELILPEQPEMGEEVLQQIMQKYIDCELSNYGIAGLYSHFLSRAGKSFTSVYIDRVFYNETQHLLSFDVLYICTEDAAEHVQKRDRQESHKVEPERAVFDDEL